MPNGRLAASATILEHTIMPLGQLGESGFEQVLSLEHASKHVAPERNTTSLRHVEMQEKQRVCYTDIRAQRIEDRAGSYYLAMSTAVDGVKPA